MMSTRPFTSLEHRWGRRLTVNIPVQVDVASRKGIDGQLQNFSGSGGLMTVDHRLRLHSRLAIYLRVPCPGYALIEAHVTRTSMDAVGLEWCDFGSRAIKHLLQEALASIRLAQSAAAHQAGRALSPMKIAGDSDALETHHEVAISRR